MALLLFYLIDRAGLQRKRQSIASVHQLIAADTTTEDWRIR